MTPPPARQLTVAHQLPGECAYCDERHAAVVAAVGHELAERQRAERLEAPEGFTFKPSYRQAWEDGRNYAADSIDPKEPTP